MRILLTAAALSLLGLAACQQPAAEDPAMATADAGADASAMAPEPTDAMGAAASTGGKAGSSAMATPPAAMPAAPASTEPMATTEETRANAKEKAEETNLHPAN